MRAPTSNLRLDREGPAEERYKILGRIASGAMGQIYLARARLADGRSIEVALKRIKPELQKDRGFREMFYDEIRVASRMLHPNIIRLLEYGELDGSIFYAMELVPGINLADVIRHVFTTSERIPLEIALSIAVQILDALDYAHNFAGEDGRPLRLVHRDVSPQNVLLAFDGPVKLLDFGVTKAEGQLHKTQPGMIKGKLAYMAPEQIRGEPVDARTDVFALGVVLYEASLLHHPFPGRTDPAVITSIMRSDPPPPHELDPRFPRVLSDIVLTALQKDPTKRFESADAMRRAITSYMDLRGWGTSHEAIERFLGARFGDRIGMLTRAKESRDDGKLVRALEVGAKKPLPEMPQMLAPPRQPEPLPARVPDPPMLEPTSEEIVPPVLRRRSSIETGDLPGIGEDRMQIGVRMERSEAEEAERSGTQRERSGASGARPSGAVGRLGRYSLLERIHGGDREVFVAHGDRGKRVAIKRASGRQSPGARQEFVEELGIAADLSHPGLMHLFETGEHQGEPYAVMELVAGMSLDRILERCAAYRVRMPLGVSCRIIADLCRPLHYLHGRSIVHRDVSRKHVMITDSGEVKLTHPRARSPAAPYTAPERLATQVSGDHATADVFSAGVLLQDCLRAAEIGVQPELEEIVAHATDRAPDRRHESARALAAELERFLHHQKGEPVTALEVADWLALLTKRTA